MSYFIVLLAGILTALPLIFDALFFLPWISLVPLFLFAVRKSSSYRHGLIFSLGYYGVLYHWFCYLYPLDFAGFDTAGSVLVIAVAWLGMSLLQGVGTAFVPLLYRLLTKNRHRVMAPFAAASLWCIMEWLQTLFWFGVPWGRLAVTQYTKLPIIQSASLFGSLGVGFLMVLVNGFLAVALEKGISVRSWKQPFALVAALLFAVNLGFGTLSLSITREAKKTFVAAAIQGNIASGDKWADDSLDTSLRIYSELTREAADETGASLIVWPETVITATLNRRPAVRDRIADLAAETEAIIAVGSYYDKEIDGENESYNAIYLFLPDGSVSKTVYQKRHLVPFGEYLPMPSVIKTVLPFLAEMNLFSDDLTQGTDTSLWETELGTIGALVCFDSIYETLTLDSVRDGAELMILSTNDSWYKDSAAVYQHNGHAVLRAVETGRSFVRAANTGISSIISEQGEVVAFKEPLVTGYATAEVSSYDHVTPYTVIGNLIVWLSTGYLALLALLRIREHILQKRQRKL